MNLRSLLVVGCMVPFFNVFFSLSVLGQLSNQSDENKLIYGKQLLLENQNMLSLDVFDLVLNNPSSKYISNALYFRALAEFRNRNFKSSDSLLRVLKAKYPKWQQEADYVRALNSFEMQQYRQGLFLLTQCTDSLLKAHSVAAKHFYLGEIKEPDTLRNLYQLYPNDTAIAVLLADKISHAEDVESKMLFDKLVVNYGIEKYRDWINKDRSSLIKNNYNVALLFPFSDGENLTFESITRDFAFMRDFYQGMSIAQEDLQKKGTKLNYFLYNTEKNVNTINGLLLLPEMRSMDLIVGPVYNNGVESVKEFANLFGIAAINPLSQSRNFVTGSPYTFSVEPSLETISKKLADFVLTNKATKNAVILYDNNVKDSLLAAAHYKSVIDSGGKVIVFREISGKSAVTITNILNRTNWKDVGHIYVSYSDNRQSSAILAALEFFDTKVPTIVPGEWLANLPKIERLEARNIHFITPSFVNSLSEEASNFAGKYLRNYHVPPSVYAYKGYDMMLFFGKLLAQYGNKFHKEIHRVGVQKSGIMPGYDYRFSHDNQFVPIYKFQKGEMIQVN